MKPTREGMIDFMYENKEFYSTFDLQDAYVRGVSVKLSKELEFYVDRNFVSSLKSYEENKKNILEKVEKKFRSIGEYKLYQDLRYYANKFSASKPSITEFSSYESQTIRELIYVLDWVFDNKISTYDEVDVFLKEFNISDRSCDFNFTRNNYSVKKYKNGKIVVRQLTKQLKEKLKYIIALSNKKDIN